MTKEKSKYIHKTAILGESARFLQGCAPWDNKESEEPTTPDSCYIGAYSIIGKNVKLGQEVIVDAYCKIGSNSVIGNRTLLTYRANVGPKTVIGEDCVIGGLIPERSSIGDRCRIFGQIVHSHYDPTMSWDHHETPEISPKINSDSFIGFHSVISGEIEIGPKSYICANSTISKTVPPYHIAYGLNKIIHYSKWKGKLKNSPFFNS